MAGIDYKEAGDHIVGYQKTITLFVKDRDGEPKDLTAPVALTGKAQLGAAAPIVVTVTADADQTAAGNRGYAEAVLTAAQLATAGLWKAHFFAGEASGAEEFFWEAAFIFESFAALA